ncbi:hypothetical protein [Flavobacterium cerinum]|uniref:Uncharacterized protein n=1 Tax=Flavobacterium cerinum TaxID=2502784 RepID=A0ABY5IS00_9FLAO|nr:hypothetical protein [Flavobacterium cerinum]UUC45593.1 hypothetical protein NOX80_18475 [Flavobacterium cerinum]
MKKNKTNRNSSAKKKETIAFKPGPNGGEYADYKLGTIARDKYRKNYSVSYGYNQYLGAANLTEAKKILDKYTAKKTKHLPIHEVKVGDRIKYDNGKERFTLTITAVNHRDGEVDVKWRNKEGQIYSYDFENGFVKKIKTTKKQ